jgi:hypothetical protein
MVCYVYTAHVLIADCLSAFTIVPVPPLPDNILQLMAPCKQHYGLPDNNVNILLFEDHVAKNSK